MIHENARHSMTDSDGMEDVRFGQELGELVYDIMVWALLVKTTCLLDQLCNQCSMPLWMRGMMFGGIAEAFAGWSQISEKCIREGAAGQLSI